MDKISAVRETYTSLAISLALGFLLFLCGYGIYSAMILGVFGVKFSVVFFIFAILLVTFSKIVEHRGAVFPNYIFGGTILSALTTFVIVSVYNGVMWIMRNGFPSLDATLTGVGVATILSFVAISFFSSK